MKLTLALAAAILLAGCVSGTGVPAASDPPSASPDIGGGSRYLVRMSTRSAIAPASAFSLPPDLVIAADRTLVTRGPVPEIYPGPLVAPLVGREISEVGVARVIAKARSLGLLEGSGDFSPEVGRAGAPTTTIELLVDGLRISIRGDAAAQIVCIRAPCDPAPGTPAAFGSLARYLSDLATAMPGELGAEARYVPAAYAVLVDAPADPSSTEPGLGSVAEWPLGDLTAFGVPVGGTASTMRCGIVRGADAATLRPALAAATWLTGWVDSPVTSVAHRIAVRPLVDDEDPCSELFGA
jgi:hypothetical protein